MPDIKKTIWLASSDVTTKKILYDRLRKQNYAAKLFESGIKITDSLKKNLPDYFLLDFNLDVIDGAKLCEFLKGDARYKRIPVILLLSEDTPENFESQADILLIKRDRENLVLKVIAALSALINNEVFPAQLWEKADKKMGHPGSAPVELFDLKNKFDAVFEKNVAGMLELDGNGRIISMNAMMESILKIPVLDIIGDNIFKVFPHWQSQLKSSFNDKSGFHSETILEHNGRYYEAKLSSVSGRSGKSGKFLMFFDITERQIYQKKLFSHTEELEGEVEKRLLQIRTTNAELGRLNQLKSEYLSNVSHEMRTPLATIKGFTETLLIRDVKPEVRKEFLGIIATETERLEKIVNDILDITKIQQGLMKKQLTMTRFNLADELKYTVKLLSPMAQKKKIKLEYTGSDGICKITADKDRIKQVLINIIENSIKFSKDGATVLLWVEKNKREVSFFCEDQGPGIPKGERTKVFEKFYMADGSDRKTEKGTGVGLFIANNIVKLHNGKIEILSGKRKGSIFVVRLPRDAGDCLEEK